MYFENLSDAIAMGGHGPYVWSAYVITLLVILGLLVTPIKRGRELRRQIRAELRRKAQANGGDARAS